MANTFHSLPPSKRYKLHQEESIGKPSLTKPTKDLPLLPAKKRTDHHDYNRYSDTVCLPAKKRIWALPSPSSFGSVEEEGGYPKKAELFVGFQQECEEDPKEVEEDEDGILCAVCKSTDGDEEDPIVFCDGCDLMVHATCYGNPLIKSIPEGDWFCCNCRRKKAHNTKAKCFLCPVRGGAMKPTTEGKMAHILCALLVPEVFFHDPVGREGIDVSKVPARRWEGECYLCGSARGCVLQCSEPKCKLQFHAYCGLEKELCLEYRENNGEGVVVGFCEDHTELWKKQQSTGKFRIVAREETQRSKRKT